MQINYEKYSEYLLTSPYNGSVTFVMLLFYVTMGFSLL